MDIPAKTQILIQGTLIGLHPNVEQKPDINYESITENMTACDVVFKSGHAALSENHYRGAQIITGIGMLVRQGALNFEFWTGMPAPVDVMYQTLENEFRAVD